MDKKKHEIIPYLSFKGNCEEALSAYIKAFGGEIYYMSRWSEETADAPELRKGNAHGICARRHAYGSGRYR